MIGRGWPRRRRGWSAFPGRFESLAAWLARGGHGGRGRWAARVAALSRVVVSAAAFRPLPDTRGGGLEARMLAALTGGPPVASFALERAVVADLAGAVEYVLVSTTRPRWAAC